LGQGAAQERAQARLFADLDVPVGRVAHRFQTGAKRAQFALATPASQDQVSPLRLDRLLDLHASILTEADAVIADPNKLIEASRAADRASASTGHLGIDTVSIHSGTHGDGGHAVAI
jgi:hypothetical protein